MINLYLKQVYSHFLINFLFIFWFRSSFIPMKKRSSTPKQPKSSSSSKPIISLQAPSPQQRRFKRIIITQTNTDKTSESAYARVKLLSYRRCDDAVIADSKRVSQNCRLLKLASSVQVDDEKPEHRTRYYYSLVRRLKKILRYEYACLVIIPTGSSSQGYGPYWRRFFDLIRGSAAQIVVIKYKPTPTASVINLRPTDIDPRLHILRALQAYKLRTLWLCTDSTFWYRSKVTSPLDMARYNNSVKRSRSLKEVATIGLYTIFQEDLHLYECLLSAPCLEKAHISIDHVSNDVKKNTIFSTLARKTSLRCIYLQGRFEILDLLKLIDSLPCLEEVRIFGMWLHDNESKVQKSVKYGNNCKNIHVLHLDTGIFICNLAVQRLYISFLRAFSNLTALTINFRWAKGLDYVGSYTTALKTLKYLKKLALAITVESLDQMLQFFHNLKSLNTLASLTLAIDLTTPKSLDKKVPETIKSFTDFIEAQKGLKTLRIYWRRVGLGYMKPLAEQLCRFQSLETLDFIFGTVSECKTKTIRKIQEEFSVCREQLAQLKRVKIEMIIGGSTDGVRIEEMSRKASLGNYMFTTQEDWCELPFSFVWGL